MEESPASDMEQLPKSACRGKGPVLSPALLPWLSDPRRGLPTRFLLKAQDD